MGSEIALAIGLVASPLAIGVAAVGAYLTFLGIAALTAHPAPPASGPMRRRFAVLVPAHDEASVIDRVLGSLQGRHIPRPLRRIRGRRQLHGCDRGDRATKRRHRPRAQR
jgi:hypothetical protein